MTLLSSQRSKSTRTISIILKSARIAMQRSLAKCRSLIAMSKWQVKTRALNANPKSSTRCQTATRQQTRKTALLSRLGSTNPFLAVVKSSNSSERGNNNCWSSLTRGEIWTTWRVVTYRAKPTSTSLPNLSPIHSIKRMSTRKQVPT